MLHKQCVLVTVTIYVGLCVCFFTMRQLRQMATSSAAKDKDRWKLKRTDVNKSLSPENDSAVVEIQLKRQKLLSDVCAGYFSPLPSSNIVRPRGPLHVIPNKSAIYCEVNKVASSSVILTIGKGLGAPRSMDIYKVQRRYLPTAKNYRRTTLRNFFKFMFVRHPFERLISAWRDKVFSRRWPKQNPQKYARTERLIKQRYRMNEDPNREPTFKEFVMFLIDPRTERPFNLHWIPFHEACLPCEVRYDFIGHYETLKQDVDYVLKKLGLHNVHLIHHNPSDMNASSIISKEMETLSHDQIKKLVGIYRLDFLLFGYSTELQS